MKEAFSANGLSEYLVQVAWVLRICFAFSHSCNLPLEEQTLQPGLHNEETLNPFEFSWLLEWRRQWHLTPVLLPWKSYGWRSLVCCSPWGRKESDMTERLHFHFSLSCIGEGNGNPLQCSCLENPRDGVAQSQTRLKWLSRSRTARVQTHPVQPRLVEPLSTWRPLSIKVNVCFVWFWDFLGFILCRILWQKLTDEKHQ